MFKDGKIVNALFPLLRIYPWAIPVIVILGLVSSFAEGIGISLFIPFLQNLDPTNQFHSKNWMVNELVQFFNNFDSDRRLLIISACIFGSILLKAVLFYSNRLLFGWLNSRISHKLRSDIFDLLLKVCYRFFDHNSSGRLLNTLSNETWQTSDALSMFVSLIITTCTIIVYVVLLMFISWKLTLIVMAFMFFVAVLTRLLTRSVKNLGKKLTMANAELAVRMLEGVEGMKVIRAFGREVYEKTRFDAVSKQLSRVLLKQTFIKDALNPIYEILSDLLLVFILFKTLHDPSNLPSLLVFIFVLYRLQPRIKSFDVTRVALVALTASVKEVTTLLDRSNKPYIISGNVRFRDLNQGIHFKGVTFKYNPMEKPALKDVSIFFPAKKTTAVVGPSGSGKSTIVKLILRFYDTAENNIFVDNEALNDLDVTSWRSQIALVSQDVYIFNTTVRENIAYGHLDANEDDIIDAAKKANAHDFICQLPNGYDSKVGDRGIRFSGGQKQRITLARAIIRKPSILILDEATNALDSISEHLIQDALDALGQDRTVIIVAHRLSTIKQAEHIVVLDEGRVSEQGNLSQLLNLDGLFTTLHNLQYEK